MDCVLWLLLLCELSLRRDGDGETCASATNVNGNDSDRSGAEEYMRGRGVESCGLILYGSDSDNDGRDVDVCSFGFGNDMLVIP